MGKDKTGSKMESPPPPRASPAPGMPTTPTGNSERSMGHHPSQNWTKDKAIYQGWHLWSEKARLALDAMEGDSEKSKISYFHHWVNGEGIGHIKSWKNNKTLVSQSDYDRLEEHKKEGKYSSEQIESYFTLFKSLLAPKSNPLLAVEELHFAKQGSMTSGEFHFHIVKIAKRCQFPNPEAEERAIRDVIFLDININELETKPYI